MNIVDKFLEPWLPVLLGCLALLVFGGMMYTFRFWRD